MNAAERRPRVARRWPKLSLTVSAILVLGTLVIAPASVEARPFTAADFQNLPARLFAQQAQLHANAKHGKKHRKAKKKRARRARPHHGHRRAVAHGTALVAASGALLDLHSHGPLPGLSDDVPAWLPSADIGEQDAAAGFVEIDHEVEGDHDEDAPDNVIADATDDGTTEPDPTPDLIEIASEFVADDQAGSETGNGNEVFAEVGDEPQLPPALGSFGDAPPTVAATDLRLPRQVPEPSTLALAGIASLAAWRLARRKTARTI